MKHFCIINSTTNIVEYIVSLYGENLLVDDGFYGVEIPEHDPAYFGMKYENGSFVEVG